MGININRSIANGIILNKQERIYSIILFAVVAWSIIARFSIYSSERSGVFVYGGFILASILFMAVSPSCFNGTNRKQGLLITIPFLVAYFFSSIVNNYFVEITPFLMLIFAFFFISSKDEIKIKSFDLFFRFLCLLLMLSLIEFIIFELTGKMIVLAQVEHPGALITVYFDHGFFNLVRHHDDIIRFQSLANEPGLIGTLCGLLLFVVGDIKQYRNGYYILWISGILTFSLAFYVFAAIRLITSVSNNKKQVFAILAVLAVLFVVFGSYIQELVINRIMSEGHGDNRSDEMLNLAFAQAVSDGTIIFGKGYRSYVSFIESGVAGAIVWIYQFGVIALILLFCVYNSIFKRKINKLVVPRSTYLLFLLVFWLSFYQRQTVDTPYTLMVFMAAPLLYNMVFDGSLQETK